MAKRRRRKSARRRPRVRTRGRRRRATGYTIGSAPIRRRRLNPRRRRRGRARRRIGRRRRNPGIGERSLLKRTLIPFAAGFATSMAAAVLDAGMASYPKLRNVVKVAGAVAIAFFGRRHPVASAAAIGALAGSSGYALGTRLAGGMIARTPEEAVKGLGEMNETYPEMGALLSGGVGALLTGAPDVPNVVGNYQVALDNMADDDDY